MNKFKSKNRNGKEYEFEWILQKSELPQAGSNNLVVDEFTVFPITRNQKGSYTLQIYVIGQEAKIVSQTRTDEPGVTGMSICEAMLPELSKYYKKTIISSSQRVPFIKGENRVPSMTKIYESLRSRGIVNYDKERDIYFFSGNNV